MEDGAGIFEALADRLASAGCVAAAEEAGELIEAAGGDDQLLESLVKRRVSGQPLAWVIGWTSFAGQRIAVHPGVYVPRWQTAPLVWRAIAALPEGGTAVDLCTGSGAAAAVLARGRPTARVLATDIDPVACACARENGVEVFEGDLDEPLPAEIRGHVDLVFGVVPYVPTEELRYLPRDARDYEPPWALDGGPDGIAVLERAIRSAARLLRPGGTLFLEVGGGEDALLAVPLAEAGFHDIGCHVDEEGDLRGIEAALRAGQPLRGARE